VCFGPRLLCVGVRTVCAVCVCVCVCAVRACVRVFVRAYAACACAVGLCLRALCVRCVCAVCALCVRCVCAVCALCVRCVSLWVSLSARWFCAVLGVCELPCMAGIRVVSVDFVVCASSLIVLCDICVRLNSAGLKSAPSRQMYAADADGILHRISKNSPLVPVRGHPPLQS